MSTPFEKERGNPGNFWLKSNPERKLRGWISYSEVGETNLWTDGALEGDHPNDFWGSRRIADGSKSILGELDDGKCITSFDCRGVRGYGSKWHTYQRNYQSGFTVVGAHYFIKDDIKLKRISFKVTGLTDWIRFSPFTVDLRSEPNHDILKILLSENVEIGLPDSILLELFSAVNQSIGLSSYSSEVTTTVTLSSQELISFVKWNEYINRFRSLLTLATYQAVQVFEFVGSTEDETKEIEIVIHRSLSEPDPIEGKEFLFYRYDFEERLCENINRWYQVYDSLEAVISLYTASIRWSNSSLYHVFQLLMQALEVYHKVRFKNRLLCNSSFDLKVRNILRESIDKIAEDELRERVERNIGNANTYTLRERLEGVLLEHEGFSNWYIGDISLFSKLMTDTRNYVSHRMRRQKTTVVPEVDLFWFNETLRLFISYLLLVELGFSRSHALSLVKGYEERTGSRVTSVLKKLMKDHSVE